MHNEGRQPGQAVQRRSGGKQLIKTTRPGRDGTVGVTFAVAAGEPGGAVSVVGDFNGWDLFAHPLRRRANGTRSAAVTVLAGAMLRFRYLAEGGIWFDDQPSRRGTVQTPASRSDSGEAVRAAPRLPHQGGAGS